MESPGLNLCLLLNEAVGKIEGIMRLLEGECVYGELAGELARLAGIIQGLASAAPPYVQPELKRISKALEDYLSAFGRPEIAGERVDPEEKRNLSLDLSSWRFLEGISGDLCWFHVAEMKVILEKLGERKYSSAKDLVKDISWVKGYVMKKLEGCKSYKEVINELDAIIIDVEARAREEGEEVVGQLEFIQWCTGRLRVAEGVYEKAYWECYAGLPPIPQLQVGSEPLGAEVYVDNVYRGVTPLTLQLQPGTYTLALRKGGYKEYAQKVIIEPGGGAKIFAKLEPEPVPQKPSVPLRIMVGEVSHDVDVNEYRRLIVGRYDPGGRDPDVGYSPDFLKVKSGERILKVFPNAVCRWGCLPGEEDCTHREHVELVFDGASLTARLAPGASLPVEYASTLQGARSRLDYRGVSLRPGGRLYLWISGVYGVSEPRERLPVVLELGGGSAARPTVRH